MGVGGINYPLDFIISCWGNYIKKMIAGTGSIMHALGQRPSIGQKERACIHTHTHEEEEDLIDVAHQFILLPKKFIRLII